MNTTSSVSARRLIYQGLLNFEQNKTRLDQLFRKTFRRNKLSDQDKRFIQNVVSGAVRNLAYLDWLLASLYKGNYKKLLKKTKSILRPALFELVYVDHIPTHATVNEYVNIAKKVAGIPQSKLVNALLRNFMRLSQVPDPSKAIKDPTERISVQYSFPVWMIKRWISIWGENEAEELCKRLNEPPDFDIRVNTHKIKRFDLLNKLKDAGIRVEASETFKQYIKMSAMQEFLSADWIKDGLCNVQDESAGIPVELLRVCDNDWFLDVCSAPGGKFTQLIEKEKKLGGAVAIDSDIKRLKQVRDNVSRYPFHKSFFIVADGRALPFKRKFDKILLDAPCSGLGVIRKHPDIKWRREMKDIMEFSELQYNLLLSASQLLKKSGRLVYSTCTIDPLENRDVIARFIENHPLFKLDTLPDEFKSLSTNEIISTYPHQNNMDGSFSAALICQQDGS